MAVKLKGLPPSSFPPWEKNIPTLGIKRRHISFNKGWLLDDKVGLLDDKVGLLNNKARLSQDLTWFSRKVPM